ncbi:MAG: hypothetical protein M9941_14915 [Anaerolineae bacterium]|nr:hypothetical protein [Anaerolineae bacterium]
MQFVHSEKFEALTKSVRVVVLVVALFYGVFSCVALIKHNGDPLWFVWIGDRFNAGDSQGNLGYDGQFVYYIAQDGWDSAEKLDIPAYRLQRILYPVVARVVSLNNPDVLPWAMLAVNFVAITATTGALAVWLRRNNCSPWYALGYGLYLGTFMAYSRDVTEPLAFGLTAIGIILWLDDKLWPALVLFALGALAKEQALLLPIGLGIAALLARNWRQVALLPLSAVPLLIWDVVLWLRFDTIPVGSGSSVQLIPLQGIVSQLTGEFGRISSLIFVAVPALLLTGIAIWLLHRQLTSQVAWMLFVNAVFVVLLPTDVFDHVMHGARNANGLVLAALFAFPLLTIWLRHIFVLWWIVPTFIWLIPVLRWAPWTQ